MLPLLLALLPAAAVAQNATATSSAASTATSARFTPLAAKRFQYDNLPYRADTGDGERGRQTGYNICNSTTEGQDSLCQTAIINAIDDFCLWAPREPNGVIGDVEGEAVAWCTKAGHGTRIIPPGALQGVQFMRTPHYVQVTGWINQSAIYIQADDYGGEMDPHGADQRGNPLGGLVFSDAWGANTTVTNGTSGGTQYQQVVEWHNFMGANQFCLKACDPSWDLDYRMCEHIYDRIGCKYNAPAAYRQGSFESCLGDDQLPPGIYVGPNNATSTYTQPPESLGVITTVPYEPFTPASSSCTSFDSASIFAVQTATSTTSSGAPTTPPGGSSGATQPAGSVPTTASGAQQSTTSAAPGGSASSTTYTSGAVLAALATVAGMLFF